MRKVGDILKKKRQEKNLTLDDVEKKTKIRKKFLLAIEEGEYSIFSSSTYLRGFIKNYSEFLNLPSSDILAIFRREFDYREQMGVLPKGLSEPLNTPLTRLTPNKIIFLIVSLTLLLFFSYLLQGYFSITGVPKLIVEKPIAGEKITGSEVTIEGETDPRVKLTINNQEVLVDKNGRFFQKITVTNNTTTIVVVAENDRAKKAVVERIIEVDIPNN